MPILVISIQAKTSEWETKVPDILAPMNPCAETFECHMSDLHFFPQTYSDKGHMETTEEDLNLPRRLSK